VNTNTTALITFTIGLVLIYASVKNRDPRDVVKEALGQKTLAPSPATATPRNMTVPGSSIRSVPTV
jgi:hypothetical protein